MQRHKSTFLFNVRVRPCIQKHLYDLRTTPARPGVQGGDFLRVPCRQLHFRAILKQKLDNRGMPKISRQTKRIKSIRGEGINESPITIDQALHLL